MRKILLDYIVIALGILTGFLLSVHTLHEQRIQRMVTRQEFNECSFYFVEPEEDEPIEDELNEWSDVKFKAIRERMEREEEERILLAMESQSQLTEMGVSIPAEIVNYCEEIGSEYDISPELLEAMCWWESRCTPMATNGSCKGVMQISEGCHKSRMKRLGVTSIFDVKGNILTGADYLHELYETYGENTPLVLDLYNGRKNALSYAAQGKLSHYSKNILQIAELLEKVNGK